MCSKTEISASLPRLPLVFLISTSVNGTTIYVVINVRHFWQILDSSLFTQSPAPPPPYHLSLEIYMHEGTKCFRYSIYSCSQLS